MSTKDIFTAILDYSHDVLVMPFIWNDYRLRGVMNQPDRRGGIVSGSRRMGEEGVLVQESIEDISCASYFVDWRGSSEKIEGGHLTLNALSESRSLLHARVVGICLEIAVKVEANSDRFVQVP